MSLEIERKWMIDQDLPEDWEVLLEENVWTTYILDEPELRVRKRGDRETVITLKWPVDSSGLVREEIETQITDDDFVRMTAGRELLRREERHLRLPTGEVLQFSYIPDLDRTYGELEFETEEAARSFVPPFHWGREVTGRVEDSFRAVFDTWQRGAFSGLYYSEPEILTADVEVLDVRGHQVRIDRQIFYPEGGGQPGDHGRLGPWEVKDTLWVDEAIWLVLDRDAKVLPGERFTASIDAPRRQQFRRQHTAEHLLSGLALKHYGVHNRGFHMNESFFTLDFDRRLTTEEIDRLVKLANEGIRTNAQVRTHYGTAERFSDVSYRSKIEFAGALRLVEIEGYDLCACSSLHVKRTGELGVLQVVQDKQVRGGSRLTVLVGEEALEALQARAHVSETLARAKSCHYENLPDRLHKDETEIYDLKQKVMMFRNSFIENRLTEIEHLDEPLVIFISGDDDDVMRVQDHLIGKQEVDQFLLLRAIGEDVFSFKLYATDVVTLVKTFSEYFEIHGGVKDKVAQGRLMMGEESTEILRALGFEQQMHLSFP